VPRSASVHEFWHATGPHQGIFLTRSRRAPFHTMRHSGIASPINYISPFKLTASSSKARLRLRCSRITPVYRLFQSEICIWIVAGRLG
jgi:hypothetical protein